MGILEPDYQLLDHTGDIGILVRARSLEELHEKAAMAMFDIILELERVLDVQAWPVEVHGEDRQDVMVRWLSELLFLYEARRLAFRRFEVEEATPTRLRARVWGEPFDPARHVARRELKAVTYHALLVSEDRDGGEPSPGQATWTARIIFDI